MAHFLSAYINALFRAPAGHYRVIVFVVTDSSFRQSGTELTGKAATNLISGGLNELPAINCSKRFFA